jgi:hypothetical protein
MALPTEKRAPQPGIGKLWIYGAPKIGKSTTAAEMDPDNAVIEDTEGSTTAIQGFIVDVRSWEEFRQYNRELAEDAAKGDERLFTTAIVDTVDVLAQLCSDSVLRGLAGLQPGQEQYLHASDFEYGKGWDAVTKEFSLRVAQLCAVVPNVVFIGGAQLADPLPMDGRRLRAALEALSAPSAPAKAPAKRPGKAAAAAG